MADRNWEIIVSERRMNANAPEKVWQSLPSEGQHVIFPNQYMLDKPFGSGQQTCTLVISENAELNYTKADNDLYLDLNVLMRIFVHPGVDKGKSLSLSSQLDVLSEHDSIEYYLRFSTEFFGPSSDSGLRPLEVSGIWKGFYSCTAKRLRARLFGEVVDLPLP